MHHSNLVLFVEAMKKVFIVDRHQHPKLLHFTQTKVMFDANNRYTAWADDIVTVQSPEEVNDQNGVIVASGEFVTTDFRSRDWDWTVQNNMIGDPDLIEFTLDYSYEMHQRPPYDQGSKQLYILENLYRTVLRSSKLIYLDNTEHYEPRPLSGSVLYGLASGWKTMRMFRDGDFHKVVVYDCNQRQLDFARQLHSSPYIAAHIEVTGDVMGSRTVPEDIKSFWPVWHRMPVEFKLMDLFTAPTLEPNSVVWVSNVFCYEPTIFKQGWEACKMARVSLQNANPSCTILEY